jgi:hypothetical protein
MYVKLASGYKEIETEVAQRFTMLVGGSYYPFSLCYGDSQQLF